MQVFWVNLQVHKGYFLQSDFADFWTHEPEMENPAQQETTSFFFLHRLSVQWQLNQGLFDKSQPIAVPQSHLYRCTKPGPNSHLLATEKIDPTLFLQGDPHRTEWP